MNKEINNNLKINIKWKIQIKSFQQNIIKPSEEHQMYDVQIQDIQQHHQHSYPTTILTSKIIE